MMRTNGEFECDGRDRQSKDQLIHRSSQAPAATQNSCLAIAILLVKHCTYNTVVLSIYSLGPDKIDDRTLQR
jgi:hypothetical protein